MPGIVLCTCIRVCKIAEPYVQWTV